MGNANIVVGENGVNTIQDALSKVTDQEVAIVDADGLTYQAQSDGNFVSFWRIKESEAKNDQS